MQLLLYYAIIVISYHYYYCNMFILYSFYLESKKITPIYNTHINFLKLTWSLGVIVMHNNDPQGSRQFQKVSRTPGLPIWLPPNWDHQTCLTCMWGAPAFVRRLRRTLPKCGMSWWMHGMLCKMLLTIEMPLVCNIKIRSKMSCKRQPQNKFWKRSCHQGRYYSSSSGNKLTQMSDS